MLVELAATVRPQLTIVDAVVSMEGDGPSSGVLRQTGWTFAARDVFALDLALCHIIGLDPAEVPTVAFAREAGMGPASLEELDFPGDGMPADIAPFARPRSREADFSTALPGPFGKLVRAAGRLLLVPRPAVSAGDCTGCGRCAESCPAGTIEMRANKAHIRYKGCIKCYCCHEMCPVGAVGIRRGGLLKL